MKSGVVLFSYTPESFFFALMFRRDGLTLFGSMVFSVASRAQPPNFKQLRIVVMVRMGLGAATDFTYLGS